MDKLHEFLRVLLTIGVSLLVTVGLAWRINFDFLSVESLGVIAGLFVAVLLPMVVLMLEDVSNNAWDRAILLTKVANFRFLLIGIGLISIALLMWQWEIIRSLLILSFVVGLSALLLSLTRSAMWLSDWTEDENGVRYRWRAEMLVSQSIRFDRRMIVWAKYLDALTDDNVKKSAFSYGKQFNAIFKENYFLASSNQDEFLTVTHLHIDRILQLPLVDEEEYLDFALDELQRLKARLTMEEGRLAWNWEQFIKHEQVAVMNDTDRAYIFESGLSRYASNSDLENEDFMRLLAKYAMAFFWNSSQQDKYYNILSDRSPWLISADKLADENGKSNISFYLLEEFWALVKTTRDLSLSEKEARKTGHQLDRLALQIFKTADPMALRRMSDLFQIEIFPGDDGDWAPFFLTRLNNVPIFGYEGRSISGFVSDSIEKDKLKFLEYANKNFEEGILVSMASLPILEDQEFARRYIPKVLESLNLLKASKSVDREEVFLTDNSLAMYIKLLNRVMKKLQESA